jgi:hypothetical protein
MGFAGAAPAGRKLLNFNICPTSMPFFWNGFCFGSLHRMNAAAAAAGKHCSFHQCLHSTFNRIPAKL